MIRKLTSLQFSEIIDDLEKGDQTFRKIGKKFNITFQRVQQIAKELGIHNGSRRKFLHLRRKPSEKEIEEIKSLKLKGVTQKDIAQMLGFSYPYLLSFAKHFPGGGTCSFCNAALTEKNRSLKSEGKCIKCDNYSNPSRENGSDGVQAPAGEAGGLVQAE